MAKFPFDCTETRQGPVDCNPGEREMNNVEGLPSHSAPAQHQALHQSFPSPKSAFTEL